MSCWRRDDRLVAVDGGPLLREEGEAKGEQLRYGRLWLALGLRGRPMNGGVCLGFSGSAGEGIGCLGVVCVLAERERDVEGGGDDPGEEVAASLGFKGGSREKMKAWVFYLSGGCRGDENGPGEKVADRSYVGEEKTKGKRLGGSSTKGNGAKLLL
ncbi:hypothetical protein H0E87_028695, partial [Populus deltoides]